VRAMIKAQGGCRRVESSLQRKARRKIEEFCRMWADSFSETSRRYVISQLEQPALRKPQASSGSGSLQAARA